MIPHRRLGEADSAAADERTLPRSGTAPDQALALDRRPPLRYGFALVLLVTVVSLLISAQGWRARIPAFDLLTYFYATHEFLESGTLPQHGDTGSYGSYKPPGTAWLLLPGMATLRDPRVFAYVGTGLLHFATLLGIFVLAWRCFGTWPASLAVVLYGLSKHGLFLAGSLWPNGRPDFYVWLVLFTTLWAVRRDARYLGAGLAVWGIGMHVDMAIAPALFILPVVWLSYRPPVRPLPLLIAGLVTLTVWSPYLSFEAKRGFVDMRAQLFLRYMLPDHFRQSWCDSSLTLRTLRDPAAPKDAGSAVAPESPRPPASPPALSQRFGMLKDKILFNFSHAVPIPGVNLVLLMMVLGTALICVVPDPGREGVRAAEPPPDLRRWAPVAVLLVGVSLFFYAVLVGLLPGATLLPASGVARKLPQALLLLGVGLLAAPRVIAATRWTLRRLRVEFHPTLPMRLLVISLLVPWLVLVIVAEPGKPERFWWVWPIQVILLAASVAYLLPKFPVPRPIIPAAQLVLALLVVLNPTLLGRVKSWRADGWAGKDAEEVQVMEYVAGHIRGDGKSEAAIGYQLFIYPFMAEYHITNPVYKVGGELELLLRYQYGIRNLDQCAEGVSPQDEYRIVQRHPKNGPEEPQSYFAVPLVKEFRLLRRFNLYDVFKRG